MGWRIKASMYRKHLIKPTYKLTKGLKVAPGVHMVKMQKISSLVVRLCTRSET
jgi:hypothetical protein